MAVIGRIKIAGLIITIYIKMRSMEIHIIKSVRFHFQVYPKVVTTFKSQIVLRYCRLLGYSDFAEMDFQDLIERDIIKVQ